MSSRQDLTCVWCAYLPRLTCLEAWERKRGDRQIGLAQWQYKRVHRGRSYDLEIDTAAATPLENARKICDVLGL